VTVSQLRSHSLRLLAAALITSLPGSALAANKDIERLQVQVAALQSQLTSMERLAEDTLRELKRLNESLAEQNAFLRKGVQDGRLKDEAILTSLREMDERMSEISEQLQGLQASRSAGPVTPAPAGGAAPAAGEAEGPAVRTAGPAPAPPAPRELYSQAYADYARGNFDLAIQEYEEYLRTYPDTDLADNAQYWIGECLYSKQQYAEALAAWDELFRRYPGSDKAPDARYKKGMALERLGRRSQAMIEYRAVASRYPNSEAGRKAREKLNPQ
jgi:tol-pal system protein YbgF